MNKNLAKNLMCVLMRSGLEIWIDEDKMDKIMALLEQKGFIKIGKEIINTVDVSGIFTPETMVDFSKRKNGQWKCSEGEWHDRFDKCQCEVVIPSYAKSWIK